MENSANPSIIKSATDTAAQTAGQAVKKPGNFFRSNALKIVIAVLIIAVLAEVVFGAFSLLSPSKVKNIAQLNIQSREMGAAQLSLIADKPNYKTGEIVEVDVKLFTGGYLTDSTDLVVKYDPLYLMPDGDNFVTEGQIYSEYPAVQVDKQNGLIGMSGITLPEQSGFSGVGTFAKLKFKALKNGQTQIAVDLQPGATSDSNVVKAGGTQDVIGYAVNANISISDTGFTDSQSQGQSCEGFTQSCQDANGLTGTQYCKGGALTQGACGYDPKMTVSCEACRI